MGRPADQPVSFNLPLKNLTEELSLVSYDNECIVAVVMSVSPYPPNPVFFVST
jgi:hypothetical protein